MNFVIYLKYFSQLWWLHVAFCGDAFSSILRCTERIDLKFKFYARCICLSSCYGVVRCQKVFMKKSAAAAANIIAYESYINILLTHLRRRVFNNPRKYPYAKYSYIV